MVCAMASERAPTHPDLAARLRNRVLTSGILDSELRLRALERGAGGAPIAEPYDALARQIGADSSRVTDEQVAAVRDALGSDVRAFEVVLAAAVGAGLRRWDAATRAIAEATDATG